MPWKYYGQMTDDELRALCLYLRSLPALPQGQGYSLLALGPPGRYAYYGCRADVMKKSAARRSLPRLSRRRR